MIRLRRFVIGGHWDGTYADFPLSEGALRETRVILVHGQGAPLGSAFAMSFPTETVFPCVIEECYILALVSVRGMETEVLIHESMGYYGLKRRIKQFVEEGRL